MNQTIQLQQQMDNAKESPLFYKIFGLVGAGIMLDAADVYMASAVNSAMIADHFATLTQGSFFLSSGFLGLFLGSILAGYIGDLKGRRQAYQLNLLVFGIMTVLGAFAPTIQILIGIRLIAAIGLGAEIVTGYSLINEFAPVCHRGRWSGIVAVVANLGAPLGLLLATILIPRWGWRSMFLVIGLLALILWFARRNFPESPRWLISQGRGTEAKKIIDELMTRGSYKSMNDKSQPPLISKISLTRGLIVATVAVSATLLCQYIFTAWVPTLLMKQGINIVHSIGFSAIMMIGAPLGALIGAALVDRIGRKATIIPSFIITAVLGLLYARQTNLTMILINGFLLTTILYVLISSVISVYAAELFPTDFRFRGTGYANGIAKLLTTLTPYLVAFALTKFNQNFLFITIAAIALFAALIVGLLGPETKQRLIK